MTGPGRTTRFSPSGKGPGETTNTEAATASRKAPRDEVVPSSSGDQHVRLEVAHTADGGVQLHVSCYRRRLNW
jgi:hypothetical protein